MPDSPTASENAAADSRGKRLESWKDIATYLGRDVTTVQRWERREGLPIRRLRHNTGGSVYAYTSELDAWRDARNPVTTRGEAPPGPATSNGSSGRRGNVVGAVVAAGVLIAALAAVAALWRDSRSARSSTSEGTSNLVAIIAPANRTGDPTLDLLGQEAAGRVIRSIRQVNMATVVPSPLAHDGDPVEDSALTVTGEYFLGGDHLTFQVRILESATGRLLHAVDPISGPRTEPDKVFGLLAGKVAGAVAIHFDEFFGGLDIVSHTPSLDAYLEYRAGHEIFERDYPRALAHLERALELDPEFWMPRLIMAFAYLNLRQEEKLEALLAPMHEQRDRLAPAERLFVDYLTELVAGRYAAAFRVLENLAKRAPRSVGVQYNLGDIALLLNRPRTAIEILETLPSRPPDLHRLGMWRLILLSGALHAVAEYERELDEARLAQRYGPTDLRAVAGEVRALSALGRLDEMTRALDRSTSIAPTAGTLEDVMEAAVLELRAHGHRDASLTVADRAVEWLRTRPGPIVSSPENRRALADALYLRERWEDAGALVVELLAGNPGDVGLLGLSGAIAARRGDRADAHRVSEQLGSTTRAHLFGYHTYLRACIASLLGEREQAVALLREAFAQGMPFGLDLHRDPDLEPLHDYPPYSDLVRPRN